MHITGRTTLWLSLVLLAAVGLSPRIAASDPGTGDWPMWGGKPDRNMVSNMKGLPTEWDVKTKKNVKWVAELGSQAYGNPVVAGGYPEVREQGLWFGPRARVACSGARIRAAEGR